MFTSPGADTPVLKGVRGDRANVLVMSLISMDRGGDPAKQPCVPRAGGIIADCTWFPLWEAMGEAFVAEK